MNALDRGYILVQKFWRSIFRSMDLTMSAFTDICDKIRGTPFSVDTLVFDRIEFHERERVILCIPFVLR